MITYTQPFKRKCIICGKSESVTLIDCCNIWFCDKPPKYSLFGLFHSKSCLENHQQQTICSYHYHQNHEIIDWKKCPECINDFTSDQYTQFSTNFFDPLHA